MKQAGARFRKHGRGVYLVVLHSGRGEDETLSSCPGVEVVRVPCLANLEGGTGAGTGELSLVHGLGLLRERYGCKSLMVEGGAKVIRSFVRGGTRSLPIAF